MEVKEDLLSLTADIAAAHVSNNRVAVGELAQLVRQIHEALQGLGQPAPDPAPAKREPVMSPKAAIKPDTIVCLVCGLKSKMLKRHLMNAHELTPEAYRREFGLKADYPMVSPNYSEVRRAHAKRIGLGTKALPTKRAAGADEAPQGRAPKGRKRSAD